MGRTMKISKYALPASLGLMALAAPKTVLADAIVQVTVSGLTFDGLNACGPSNSLCSQTVNESFQWDNTTGSFVAGTFSFSTFGALGSSASSFSQPLPLTNISFTAFVGASTVIYDSAFDSLNFFINTPPTATLSQLPPGNYTNFSGVGSAPPFTVDGGLFCSAPGSCVSEFGSVASPTGTGLLSSSGMATVSPVPEPSPALLMGAGLLCLMGMHLFRKRTALPL